MRYQDMPNSLNYDSITEMGDFFDYSMTLVNLELPDQALVYVNNEFLENTGYEKEEVIGKNCRFLQGPDTSESSVNYIRNSIKKNIPVFVDILNYRKNGDWFFNRLILIPLLLKNKKHYLGLQLDSSHIYNHCKKRFSREKTASQLSEELLPHLEKIDQLIHSVEDPFAAFSDIKPEIDLIREFVIEA